MDALYTAEEAKTEIIRNLMVYIGMTQNVDTQMMVIDYLTEQIRGNE
jgi:hypothetical protein